MTKTCLFLALLLAAPQGAETFPPKEQVRPIAPTPTTAQHIFDRLVVELPPRMRPAGFRYRLTALDFPGQHAFTTASGAIYVPQPLAASLLADTKRGDAALAFVLADEIGHLALGHCRRVMAERDAAAEITSFLPFRLPLMWIGAGPDRLIYTAAEREDADRFALHLCRNAGFDLDAVLDSVRVEANSSVRLKRLLMERDGVFDDEMRYGLFLFDRRSCKLTRCSPRQIGPNERPIVLIHGLRGNEWALGAYLVFLRHRVEVADRPLLVFRYPNNESLSRCGQFLTREMERVVVEPEKVVFICHSAGGLVFRWYAEVRRGGFDKAIFLAVPQAGTNMADLKGFVDVGRFVIDIPCGLDYAMRNYLDEGDGEIARDLKPDSLFLRRLGRETPPVQRYQIFYGQFFDLWQTLEMQAGFIVAKSWLEEAIADFVPFPTLQSQLIHFIATVPLPVEVTGGDLVVSAHSAKLPGVSRITVLAAQHEAFRYDPEIMRRVLDAILR